VKLSDRSIAAASFLVADLGPDLCRLADRRSVELVGTDDARRSVLGALGVRINSELIAGVIPDSRAGVIGALGLFDTFGVIGVIGGSSPCADAELLVVDGEAGVAGAAVLTVLRRFRVGVKMLEGPCGFDGGCTLSKRSSTMSEGFIPSMRLNSLATPPSSAGCSTH